MSSSLTKESHSTASQSTAAIGHVVFVRQSLLYNTYSCDSCFTETLGTTVVMCSLVREVAIITWFEFIEMTSCGEKEIPPLILLK